MSKENFAGKLVEPTNYELDFCLALEYELVIAHAGDKLALLLIDCIRKLEAARPWYLGETSTPPDIFLSSAFNPHENRACSRFDRFISRARRYPMGRVPIDRLSTCRRVAHFFCREASSLLRDVSATRLSDAIEELHEFLSGQTSSYLSQEKYETQLDHLAQTVKDEMENLRDAFYRFEQRRLKPVAKRAPEASEQLDEIERTVNRIDARSRKACADKRCVFSAKTQELVQTIWARANESSVLRREAKSRVSKKQAFMWARDDLRALGIETLEQFSDCLGAHSDRLYRARRKSCGR